MSNPEVPQSENITLKPTESISFLDNAKAYFYMLNAKPDTEIRFLKGDKVIEIADIRSIEEQVAAKLRNHNTLTKTVTISFTLSNTRCKEFSTWAEFERERWHTVNEQVESLAMNWNIMIQLPQYELPQTHSVKLRIGSSITPKDFLQLLLTSDDASEVMEARSPGVCKVDFINSIVANELLTIVTEWYAGLKKCPEPEGIQWFLERHGKLSSQAIRFFFPLVLLFIACTLTKYLHPLLGINQELSISNIQGSLVFLLAVFMLGSFLGSLLEKSIDKRIDKLEKYPNFSISKGDENAIDKFQRNNKKLSRQILSRVIWLVFSIPISAAIKFAIDYFSNSKN